MIKDHKDTWTETQKATCNRIAAMAAEEQPRELLKWALARVTFYGPCEEPVAECIREYLDNGAVKIV